jgi:hypothetical protein
MTGFWSNTNDSAILKRNDPAGRTLRLSPYECRCIAVHNLDCGLFHDGL